MEPYISDPVLMPPQDDQLDDSLSVGMIDVTS
jgi:hypothetical protein